MKFRLKHILLLAGALLAFLPVLGVDYLLDSYIKNNALSRFQDSVNTITSRNQNAVRSAIVAMNRVVKESPSLCTPTFVSNVQKQLLAKQQLAQIIVENKDKVQYCNGYNSVTEYILTSAELPIHDSTETIAIAKVSGSDIPMIRVSSQVGQNKIISAFVHLSADLDGILPNDISENAYLRIGLTNGTKIITSGDVINDVEGDVIHTKVVLSSISNSIPIDARMTISFDSVKAVFADLYLILTIAALVMAIGFLIFVFYFIRRSNIPSIDLERAIIKGEFQPYYQPVVNLKTGQLIGCEVLVRWVKKDGTVLSPGFFIDLAESSGLAVPMTIKLMEQVREDLSELSKHHPELKIGINLFEGHFRNSIIVDDVKAIFSDSNVLFSQLVFEITERRPLTNQIAVDAVVGGLQALGCKLALDDAGTGYSNLAYMERLGVDIIKIDRVFVNMIGNGTSNVPILDGLISMAFDLDAEIIAEGIETEEQAVYLRARGVVQAQGFLFAPALKKEIYIELAQQMNKPAKPKLAKVEDSTKTSKKAA